jgi:hypothetical protein
VSIADGALDGTPVPLALRWRRFVRNAWARVAKWLVNGEMKRQGLELSQGLTGLVVALMVGATGAVAGIKPTLRPRGGPHGGTLISIDGGASVEVVYDCPSGRLTAHVVDARGAPLPIRQDHLRLQVGYADVDGRAINGPAAQFSVDLDPAPRNPREPPPREASQFSAESADLRGVCHLVGNIESLEIGATALRDIPFRYPGP